MSDLITLFNQAEVHHSQNWMFFIVVVFGILGYCFTEKYKEIEASGIVILTIGLIAFSIYNGDAMIKDVTIYNHLLDVLKKPEDNTKVFNEAVKIYKTKWLPKILVFHILISLLAILVIIRKYLSGFIKRSRDKIVG